MANFGGKVRAVIRELPRGGGTMLQPQVPPASVLGANGKWVKMGLDNKRQMAVWLQTVIL